MNFTPVEITVNATPVVFSPYDRGAKGAFVYRENGVDVMRPRVVVNTVTDDKSSDRYSVQHNKPVMVSGEAGMPDVQLGTDLIKTDFRFLATSSSEDRLSQIDTHIALLEEFKLMMGNREKVYA